jgi:hypothetical protein
MDTRNGRVAFAFANLSTDLPSVVEPHDVYLRIVSDFSVSVDGERIYDEQLFTIVEFAVESQAWLRRRWMRRAFVFTSMEAEEPLLWIRPNNWIVPYGTNWTVGSDITGQQSPGIDFEEIKAALNNLHEGLSLQVKSRFNHDIETLFDWRTAHIG